MASPTDPRASATPEEHAPRWHWWSARARRDFVVGLGIALGTAALVVLDQVAAVFPFLAPLERTGWFTDELVLAIVVAAALGFTWAVRRGAEMRAALRELSTTRRIAEVGFDESPIPTVIIDTETLRFLAVNDAALRQYGWSREEFLTQLTGPALSPPGGQDAARTRALRYRDGPGVQAPVQHVRKDGSTLWVEVAFSPIRFLGRPATIGVGIDVTAREEVAAQRHIAEARFRAVFDTNSAGVVEITAPHTIVDANACFARMLGRTRDELAGMSLLELTHADDVAETQHRYAEFFAGRRPAWQLVKRYLRADGSPLWAIASVSRVVSDGTDSPRTIGVVVDLTDLRRAEEAREQLHQRLELALDATGEGLWDWNLTTDECFYSPALARMLGVAPAEIAPDITGWNVRIHPDDALRVELALTSHLAGETAAYESEHRLLRGDGDFVWVLDRGRVVQRDSVGKALRMVGTFVDMSARRDLEEQLRQAQKMEAIGQLAGGVAHDFNNLLTVIRTGLELALAEELPEEVRADLSEVEMATERAATLTSQLLAFSRRRLEQPRLMTLNDAVNDLARLLNRVLTEDIEVRRRLDAHLRVLADPGHLGQALLNIAVNARDAMPNGGVLTLATFDTTIDVHSRERHDGVPPGRYSVVAIGDTGTGMTPEVRAHIFEPFFTTKPLGKGTGLGLASVYGIVKQVDGAVRVESTPGLGTTFLLYFPEAEAELAALGDEQVGTLPGGSEVVLVAEDDPAVRSVATRVLTSHGYRVRQAADGAQAATLLEAESGIACLVTDVVMPVMSGSALVALVRARFPATAVLAMSAHSHEVLSQFPLPADTRLLVKPFTSAELLLAVRAAIDARVTRG